MGNIARTIGKAAAIVSCAALLLSAGACGAQASAASQDNGSGEAGQSSELARVKKAGS
ncbi:hypothetical protein [Bifidobacterium miconisargentati]|uniref:hypothetical protein n=1 Tax=Bifidobacterium miconisargentati TaxID=2834437 RepID=UPI001F1B6897|nr:hypothetical protein [Bifidobacterium miconisargentati]